MLATAIIVFRETLEAALIVGIVMAATAGIEGRTRFIVGGLSAGLLGAVVVGLSTQAISAAADGFGQELLNAAVLLLAVLMLGWHTVWMAQHAREMTSDLRKLGQSVASGERPLIAIAIAVAVAVMREGSETVLFVYGIATAGADTRLTIAAGSLVGLLAGVAAGAVLYAGLLRIPVRHFFTVTGAMIMLVTAGLAAQAAGFLAQADVIPEFGSALWDTSAILDSSSVLGRVLHTLVGYEPRPSGVQVLAYVATLGTLLVLTNLVERAQSRQRFGAKSRPVAVER